jgi:hypothetical protein
VGDPVQIVENWSLIRGRVEDWKPPPKPGDPGTLTIAVERVEDVASPDGTRHRNLLAGAVGTTIQVIVPASAAARVGSPKGSSAVVEVRRSGSPERVFANPERITLTPL